MRAQVVAELSRNIPAVLHYGTASDLTGASTTSTVTPTDNLAKFTITGLAANTQYYCAVSLGGKLYLDKVATFTTPTSGAHSFSFATGSCMYTQSSALIFDNIRTSGAEFFVQTGDIQYENITTNDASLYRDAWHSALRPQKVKALFDSMPVYHIWDDNDYGANNADSTSASKAAAQTAFRAQVPVTEFADDDAVYYSFVRGRVRFIMTDLRSERSPNADTDDSSKKMMSDTQLAWMISEIEDAETAGQVVIWASSVPWVGVVTAGADRWAGFSTQRTEIAGEITTNSWEDRVCIISGDMHAMAFDDGTNAAGGINVMQAAPLDQAVSGASYTYSEGPIVVASTSQYGFIDVTDTDGATINIRFRGISVDVLSGTETVEIDENFDLTP
jgi:phosphodiesterase/alkaline phosphatase D-like protein